MEIDLGTTSVRLSGTTKPIDVHLLPCEKSDYTNHHETPLHISIVIDEREHALYNQYFSIGVPMQNVNHPSISVAKKVLPLGDVIIQENDKDICVIERKTLSDLLASIKDGRYEEQSHRLLHATNLPPHQIVYIIEGIISQLDLQQKQLVYSAITSLSLYKGFTVMRTSGVQETADYIMAMANKIKRNLEKGKRMNAPSSTPPAYETMIKRVKKDNVTNDNIMNIMLCQIPGISDVISSVLVEKFHTFPTFIKELENNPHCLDGLQYICNGKSRKVGSNVIQNIRKYLGH